MVFNIIRNVYSGINTNIPNIILYSIIRHYDINDCSYCVHKLFSKWGSLLNVIRYNDIIIVFAVGFYHMDALLTNTLLVTLLVSLLFTDTRDTILYSLHYMFI